MALLLYSALMSLDGFIADDTGRFDWAVPDSEVHDFINRLESGIGTHLYGRRMYETMAVWETLGDDPGSEAEEVAYAVLWRNLEKIVNSTSLDAVWTPRTTLERSFDPDALTRLKETVAGDISVSGSRNGAMPKASVYPSRSVSNNLEAASRTFRGAGVDG